MARLNDPPAPPTESIDALKRRFIRQNRELARVNSTQSQRIRNLETEISRLLAENINLREQAIAASAEAEKLRTTSRLGRDVVELKIRLESKLSEVHALVEELGGLPEKAARRSSFKRRRSGFMQHVAASPEQKEWRNRQTLGGVFSGDQDGQDGRLPAILEDKYYPRRTLENEELRILTAAANFENEDTESPDIGPPPVAHFEDADPIVFDRAKSPKRVSGGIISAEDEVVSLSKNLETRRKRRTSSLLQDMSSLQHGEVAPKDAEGGLAELPKQTSKRKFDVSEMEFDSVQPPQNDGFEYTRRDSISSTRSKPSRFAPRPVDSHQVHAEAQAPSPQKAIQPRTVLAQKSTNSPTKKATATFSEKVGSMKVSDTNQIKSTTRRAPEKLRISRIEPPHIDEQSQESCIPPRTPAPPLEDVLSPPSSAMDTLSKAKSTEAAITNSVEDVLNGSIGRGSRRARSAVSYAEPNLRDKMRRPDKKLVGAVEGLTKPASTSDRETSREPSQLEGSASATSASGLRIIKIKSEKKVADEDSEWKNFPEASAQNEVASPLQDKEKQPALRISDIRRKRTYSESEGLKSKTAMSASTSDDLDKAVSRLSIFDHPTSSPISSTKHTTTGDEDTVQLYQPTKPTSSIPTTTARKAPDRPVTSAASTTKSRRHSVQPQSEHQGKENLPAASAVAASKLKRSSSVQTMSGNHAAGNKIVSTGTGTGTAATAVERGLGARRRSMMI